MMKLNCFVRALISNVKIPKQFNCHVNQVYLEISDFNIFPAHQNHISELKVLNALCNYALIYITNLFL